ncbi:MAG: hypothetical protein EZS28_055188 [Streblomastix strix]|uniref:Uncharacterized protein n=1 Tax=Streblomastix strix TaxID=222440 RepID=A0A5J4Q5I9_9EUKA|nr:MAG: hypothetical protein EZS28_055188 [Streblomastix strix]
MKKDKIKEKQIQKEQIKSKEKNTKKRSYIRKNSKKSLESENIDLNEGSSDDKDQGIKRIRLNEDEEQDDNEEDEEEEIDIEKQMIRELEKSLFGVEDELKSPQDTPQIDRERTLSDSLALSPLANDPFNSTNSSSSSSSSV